MPMPLTQSAGAQRFWSTIERSADARTGCTAEILDHWSWGGCIFDDDLMSLVRGHAAALGYSHRDLASQAGHDAYFLSRTCPTDIR